MFSTKYSAIAYALIIFVILNVYLFFIAQFFVGTMKTQLEQEFFIKMHKETNFLSMGFLRKNKVALHKCFFNEQCGPVDLDFFYDHSEGVPVSSYALVEKKGNQLTIIARPPEKFPLNTIDHTDLNDDTIVNPPLDLISAFHVDETQTHPNSVSTVWGDFFVSYVPIVNYFDSSIAYVLVIEVPASVLATRFQRVDIARQTFISIGVIFSIILCFVVYVYLTFMVKSHNDH